MARVRCDGCGVYKVAQKTIRSDPDLQRYQFAFPERQVNMGHKFCAKCRAIADRITRYGSQRQSAGPGASQSGPSALRDSSTLANSDPDFGPDNDPLEGDSGTRSTHAATEQAELMQMPFKRVVPRESACFICGSRNGLHRVSLKLRTQVFLKRRFFVPKNNLCCGLHLIREKLFEDELKRLRPHANTTLLDEEDLMLYIKVLADEADMTIRDRVGTLDLTDEQVEVLTGLTYDSVVLLASMMTSIRNVEGLSVTQSIIIFLFKICIGSSNAAVARVFGLESAEKVSRIFNVVINSFKNDVLPSRFGFAARKRMDLVRNESSDVARQLFGVTDRLALICDGTFHRYRDSPDGCYQRKSYSGREESQLYKQFTICTTTGYIVGIIGPFNDDTSMKTALEKSAALGELLTSGDAFFVDRASKDVVDHLKQKGCTVYMPLLKGARDQLRPQESNDSRFVSKVRWVVDAVQGKIKQKYRILNHQLNDDSLPKIEVLTRIAFFLNNYFEKRLTPDQTMLEKVLRSMQSMRNVPNSLAREVEMNEWNRAGRARRAMDTGAVLDFPMLTVEDLTILFKGAYQLSQAVSYLMELQNTDNTFNVKIHDDRSHIIKLEVQSRHVKSKAYKCYIDYEPNSIKYRGIRSRYCECLNGTRTVGCCSHVAAVIFYLSYARFLSKVVEPARILLSLSHDGVPVIDEDSDED